ncbi:MAG TPA: hypothetical protein VJN18_17175 [Polyangiaceae bacterium]|nr:hypothetical protein [Polyangiaceae bacterium]
MSRVPPHPSGGKDLRPGAEPEELEQLEELGDDAIIAQQQGAHAPKPRAQVTEEARSVVISDHPPQGSSPPPAPAAPAQVESKRRERQEQTVVIRDRRKIDELRREMELRKQKMAQAAAGPGLWLWVVVGLAAFLMGGLVALFATREDESGVAPLPSAALQAPTPTPLATESAEPPSVSIDELPVEGNKKPK